MIVIKRSEKIIIVVLVIIAICQRLVLVEAFISFFFPSVKNHVKNEINLDLKTCKIVRKEDTHGGFLGDGDFVLEADCGLDSSNILTQVEKWKKLPLSENLQLIMYGGKKNERMYSYFLALKNNIPEISNGYYYFIDRAASGKTKYSDKELFNRYSFNFTLAMYDLDSNRFYYYEFDT